MHVDNDPVDGRRPMEGHCENGFRVGSGRGPASDTAPGSGVGWARTSG